MILEEYNEAETMDLLRKEAREDGFKEGLEQGEQAGLEKGKEEGYKEGHEKGKQEGLQRGREDGLREGKKEGRKSERQSIIQKALEAGNTPESIAQILQIPMEEIEPIAEKLKNKNS